MEWDLPGHRRQPPPVLEAGNAGGANQCVQMRLSIKHLRIFQNALKQTWQGGAAYPSISP